MHARTRMHAHTRIHARTLPLPPPPPPPPPHTNTIITWSQKHDPAVVFEAPVLPAFIVCWCCPSFSAPACIYRHGTRQRRKPCPPTHCNGQSYFSGCINFLVCVFVELKCCKPINRVHVNTHVSEWMWTQRGCYSLCNTRSSRCQHLTVAMAFLVDVTACATPAVVDVNIWP